MFTLIYVAYFDILIIMKRIILSGGGTLGSVSPLVAIYEEIRLQFPDSEFLWIGTKNGPEKKMAESYGIPYQFISSGKLRRYFSLRNFFDIFLIVSGFFESIFLIKRFRPSLVLTAGGFVAVPVAWAAWISRVPFAIHQQDARVGLANRLMAPFASLVTATFEKHKKDFGKKNVVVTGNPFRNELAAGDKESAVSFFGFLKDMPVVLVLGGGTGARTINEIISRDIPDLSAFCQIIHSTGEGKFGKKIQNSRYRAYEFLYRESLAQAYAAANLVVTRGGMSTLTELANLRKPIVIIPIPGSHQIDNALEFEKRNAAKVFGQRDLTPENFTKIIRETLRDKNLLQKLSENISTMFPKDAARRVVEEIINKLSKLKIS